MLLLVVLHLDPVERTLRDPRWELWRQTVQTFDSATFGRGIGSYQQIMPYFISGNERLVETKITGWINGRPALAQDIWWNYAHNEYLQAGFELGIHGLVLVLCFIGWTMIDLVRRRRKLTDAGIRAGVGITALAVASLGWFPLHVAPLALVGMAWIGIWERENTAQEGRYPKGAGVGS